MINKIIIQGIAGKSTVLLGETIENLQDYIPHDKVIIITDKTVYSLYRDKFPPGEVITIGTGESIKNLETIQYIYDRLVAIEAERSSFILGIGGGIVCDITGFVASTYLRGIRFGFVSSTLLCQVDASLGGKNGINFKGYKNIIGVFNQPEFVLCDLNLLRTLPKREILCGLAEIVKHAVIGDTDMFRYLEAHSKRALSLDIDVIQNLVHDSIRIKSSVVNRDEREKGERRKLNFGHTIGHALEKTAGVPHGEAISAGMVVASQLSEKRGLLPKNDVYRIRMLLRQLQLPISIECNKDVLFEALKKDKKRDGDHIHFVLLDSIGSAVVEAVSISEIKDIMNWPAKKAADWPWGHVYPSTNRMYLDIIDIKYVQINQELDIIGRFALSKLKKELDELIQ